MGSSQNLPVIAGRKCHWSGSDTKTELYDSRTRESLAVVRRLYRPSGKPARDDEGRFVYKSELRGHPEVALENEPYLGCAKDAVQDALVQIWGDGKVTYRSKRRTTPDNIEGV